MSLTVIFSVGVVVFALTVWGVVMAGGYWLSEIADSQEGQTDPGTGTPPPAGE